MVSLSSYLVFGPFLALQRNLFWVRSLISFQNIWFEPNDGIYHVYVCIHEVLVSVG